MQHVVRIAPGYPQPHRLQSRTYARERPAVVCTELGNRAVETALPLGHVICDVGHEICVCAVRLAHDAVLVVAELGCAQPESAVMLERLARCRQSANRFI